MSPDDPRHGSHNGSYAHYRDGEKPCDACRAATSRYNKGLTFDRHQGRPREVELGPVALGIVNRAQLSYLAEVSGLTRENLVRIHRVGTAEQRVFRTTRDAIIGAGARANWSTVGIQRRVRALYALGWNAANISEAGGPSALSIYHWLDCEPRYARHEFALKALKVYAKLSGQPAPADTPHRRSARTKSLRLATERGWAPPLAWDDIDDPSEVPSTGPKARRRIGDMLDEFHFLVSTGESPERAALRVGASLSSLNDMRRRAEREAS